MAIDVRKLYERFGAMVHRRCRSMLGDEVEAADAMHDVFVRLVRKQQTLTERAPAALLYKMATHVCLNRMRTRRRRPEVSADTLLWRIAAADEPDADVERRSLLGRIFGREKPSTRVIATLHWVDGMTLEETAATVGLSVSGVRKRLRVLQARAGEALQEVP